MYNKKIIYVDHSATTKVREEVVEAIIPILKENFGNPSSIHQFGRRAKSYLNEAREKTASVINANEEEIIFTSGGTESNNLVIFGIQKLLEEGNLKNKDKHIITSKIEHPAVKEPLEYLEKKGWRITWLNVDNEGFVSLNELTSSITTRTALVSIIHANNEIGTVQDLKAISNICKEKNVLFHTDIVQSFGKIPIDVRDLNIDFMSMSAHKIYGPKGVGALYSRSANDLSPVFMGGGQEKIIRPGTENLPGIVGFGVAAELIKKEMKENAIKLRSLQIELMEGLLKISNVILTGANIKKVKENFPIEKYLYRLPGHVSICMKDIEGENLVLQADLKGIAASSGSACSSGTLEPSHVLIATNVPSDYVRGSLRLTLGRENTTDEIEYIIKAVKEIQLVLLPLCCWLSFSKLVSFVTTIVRVIIPIAICFSTCWNCI